MKPSQIITQILNIVRNIEKEQNSENRNDRLNGLKRENELLRGNQEETDRRLRAMEKYLGVEYVRDAHYKLIKK